MKNVALNTSSSFVTRGRGWYDFILGIWTWGEIFWGCRLMEKVFFPNKNRHMEGHSLFFNPDVAGSTNICCGRICGSHLASKRGRDYRVMLLSQGDERNSSYHQGFLITLWNFWGILDPSSLVDFLNEIINILIIENWLLFDLDYQTHLSWHKFFKTLVGGIMK